MAEPLLRIAGLGKRFGGVHAVEGADLEVLPGEIHALIGPNGAGKTTLIDLVSGALAADAGQVLFAGRPIGHLPAHARVARGLARSFQVTSIFRRFTVRHNLALAVQARSGSSFRFWRPAARERSLAAALDAALEQAGLLHCADVPAGELAHGEQRQLEIALALATRPRLILLDEPLAGMGPEESERMMELIGRLRSEVTMLLVEHDMSAVFRLADRISVLVGGRMIACGSPQAIRADDEVRCAYLGTEQV